MAGFTFSVQRQNQSRSPHFSSSNQFPVENKSYLSVSSSIQRAWVGGEKLGFIFPQCCVPNIKMHVAKKKKKSLRDELVAIVNYVLDEKLIPVKDFTGLLHHGEASWGPP